MSEYCLLSFLKWAPTSGRLLQAPVYVKELCVTFGQSSKEAVLGLVEKTHDHLERLALTLMYESRATFTDEELCRLWRLLEAPEEVPVEPTGDALYDYFIENSEKASGVKALALSSPELLRSVPFPFEVRTPLWLGAVPKLRHAFEGGGGSARCDEM